MGCKIFLMGITGYVGGSVFAALEASGKHSISALVRSQEKADWLTAHGVRPVLGDLNNLDLIENAASEADVFINTADSDHMASAKATLAGLKKRYEKTGKNPLYLHTSGTGILIDSTDGTRSEKIWRDTDTEALEAIPETALHRKTDIWLLKNSESVELCIISPPAIHGRGSGYPELSNTHSVQIPFIIAHAIRNKKTFQIGPGENIGSEVHVEDLAQLYVNLLEIYLASGQVPSGYLFPENGEHVMGELTKCIAQEVKNQGVLDTDEVVSVEATDSELKRVFGTVAGKYLCGGSPRARGPKARSTGWVPRGDDVTATVALEVKEISRAMKDGTYKFFGHNRSETKYQA